MPCMHPHAPSRILVSSAQPRMHPHAPSCTPVSSAHSMCAPAGFLLHPCQLRSARYEHACSLSHLLQLRTARCAPACSLSYPVSSAHAMRACFFRFPLYARLSAQLRHVCTRSLLIAPLSAPRMPCVPPQSRQYVNYRQQDNENSTATSTETAPDW